MSTHRTVLVITRSDDSDDSYRRQLEQDRDVAYRVLSKPCDAPALALSQLQQVDGILLELSLPQAGSIQFLRQLKEQLGDDCPPIVVIDGGDTDVAVQAFKNGAVDYLVRDRITPDDLRQAMRTAIENAELRRELQRSQEQFQTSVENMLDCFGIFSAIRDDSGRIVDFRIEYLNAAACENNQMPKAMQLGRRLCELFPAHCESSLFDEYCQVVETGQPLIKDSLVYDDTYGDQRLVRVFDIRATRLNDGFVASWRDVTDRRQTEQQLNQTLAALQSSQQRLELAMKAAKMGSWDWDIPTGRVYWSANLEHLFDMAPGSFDGQYETVREMIHPEDLPTVEQAIQRALHDREEYNIEFRFIKPDGTVRWAVGMGRVFYDASGTPVKMAGVDMDISERKWVEASLQASERHFRNMADNAPVMIWVTDASGCCTYLNQGWYDFTGQTEETGLGFGWLDAVHPEDMEPSKKVFLEAIEQHQSFQLEYRLRRKNGVYRWAIDAASPWFDEAGAFQGYIGSVIDISDRKQAEIDLAVNEARLRGFVDANVVGILYGDIHGRIFGANDELLRIVGYSREDLDSGRLCWITITPPEYLPLDERGIAEARANGACTPYEKEYIRKDGRRVPVLIGYSLVGDAQEDTVVFILDLSDRKKAEEALRQSEERYRTLFESIDEGFCVIEMLFDESQPVDYRFLETNPAFEKHTGLTHVQGKRMRELVPNHEEYWFEIYGNVARTGAPSRFESRAEAMQRWFDVYAFPISSETPKVAVLFNDITARKQTEAALRESENRLRLAMESAELGTWDFNPVTNVLRWDTQCRAMFGLSPDTEVTFDVFLAGLHPDDRDRTYQVVQQSFNPEGGGDYDIEYRTVGLEDGIERWVAAKGKAFFNPEGEVIRFIGTVLNITEKKRAEAEREQLLQREQAARADAERANRIKDEFLAVLSHELRSPLNPILGWTKLLQIRKFDEAKTAEALATIERNAKLQTQLIDDLLDVAKILRGKLSLSLSPVNLAFVVESAIETVRSAAIAKFISLHPVLPNVGQVSGDAARLQQVVWNLLSNAVKFTPSGGRVDIRLEPIGNQVQIIVADTGKGIRPDFLPHLFESFRQEDASITRRYGGLGLGLAIVRQLVEAHGGTIAASSPGEGLGATFTVRLPLLNGEAAVKPTEELPQRELDLTGIRVLAVDDDPDARDLLTVLLIQYGADVRTVTCAAEVLQNLASFQPDVLVSDIGMPQVDGYSLIQQVRALPASQGGQIPAIALTAYAREDDQMRSLSSGYQQHVTKPLEPERLVKAILRLTQGQRPSFMNPSFSGESR